MSVLGGYIVTRPDGGPSYGFGGNITIYPDSARAAKVAAFFSDTMTAVGIGLLSVAPVELKIIQDEQAQEKGSG